MVRNDNGPQFDCQEFHTFTNNYRFRHQTSSPHFPQSNGSAVRALKTIKKLLWKSTDPYITLLNYRATPLHWCELSPTELLMGRQVRTTLPQVQQKYIPQWAYLKHFEEKDHLFKAQQKRNNDKRHQARPLPSLPENTPVLITSGICQPGNVVSQAATLQSYLVDTPSGQVHRNRQHVIPIPESHPNTQVTTRACRYHSSQLNPTI